MSWVFPRGEIEEDENEEGGCGDEDEDGTSSEATPSVPVCAIHASLQDEKSKKKRNKFFPCFRQSFWRREKGNRKDENDAHSLPLDDLHESSSSETPHQESNPSEESPDWMSSPDSKDESHLDKTSGWGNINFGVISLREEASRETLHGPKTSNTNETHSGHEKSGTDETSSSDETSRSDESLQGNKSLSRRYSLPSCELSHSSETSQEDKTERSSPSHEEEDGILLLGLLCCLLVAMITTITISILPPLPFVSTPMEFTVEFFAAALLVFVALNICCLVDSPHRALIDVTVFCIFMLFNLSLVHLIGHLYASAVPVWLLVLVTPLLVLVLVIWCSIM